MHSAVLQNSKYMKFAAANTVEVLSLGDLEKGIEKQDPRAATYKGKNEAGEEVDLMVSWPNLTFEQIQALRNSKAGQYNDTGKIPYTAIVDPHTLEKMSYLAGGSSGGQVMDKVAEAQKILVKEHGKGLRRDEIEKTKAAIAKAKIELKDGDFDGAITLLEKAGHGNQKTNETLATLLNEAHAEVVAAANARFEAIVAMEAKEQKRELRNLKSKVRKIDGLEDKVSEALKALSESED